MSTLFEPSLSTSAMRAPLSTAAAPSMADSLPAIAFGFDDLRERMARFTDRFDEFIAQGRKQVLEERNRFRINVAELQGKYIRSLPPLGAFKHDQRTKQKDIELLAQKFTHHAATVSAQEAETAEMQSAIAAITHQRDAHAHHRDRLRAEIATINKDIAARRSAQEAHAKELEAQSRLNGPELDFWETYLGLRIEGAGQVDRLKFVFGNLDERDWEKEAWFELDTERREYRVVDCGPKVEDAAVEACVERLNESRELGPFLRGMREVFVKGLK